MSQPLLYSGSGDYSTIYTGLANNSIDITTVAQNSTHYAIDSAGFGRMVFNSSGAPYSAYFKNYQGSADLYAKFAYNF